MPRVPHPKTLLIADDNAPFSRMVAAVAQRRGWTSVAFHNGNDLIAGLTKVTGPALLFLDILMPDLDGIETVAQLGKSRLGQGLRIRFVTGGDHSNATAARMIALARSFDVGATLYKPMTVAEIEAVLVEEASAMDLPDNPDI